MEPTRTLEKREQDSRAPAAAATRAVAAAPDVTLTPVPMAMWVSVRAAWAERALVPQLGVRFLLKRIRGTKLGWSWLIIRPLMAAVGMTLLFGGVLKVATPGGAPYFLFLLAGLVGWRMFERSLLYTTRSFSLYRKLMKTMLFPLLLVPLAGMGLPLVETAVYWAVFAGSLVFYWIVDGTLYLSGFPRLLWTAPALALLTGITVGAALWLSVLNAKARDVRYSIRYVLPIWMYVTPVVYPISQLPESVRWLGIVNPMSGPIELLKWGLIGEGQIHLPALASSVGFGGLLLLSGLWFFCREAARSIDAIEGPDDEEDEEV
jgi:lipopolysaccharide transport system permease protein